VPQMLRSHSLHRQEEVQTECTQDTRKFSRLGEIILTRRIYQHHPDLTSALHLRIAKREWGSFRRLVLCTWKESSSTYRVLPTVLNGDQLMRIGTGVYLPRDRDDDNLLAVLRNL
jgi:hypothetical protein